MNSFGIDASDRETILSIFATYPEIESAVLYGSRARGNFKPGSDIDLVLTGKKLTDQIALDVRAALRDSSVPFVVDLIAEHEISDRKLKREIDITGQLFYQQSEEEEEPQA